MEEKKVATIFEWPEPDTVKALQRFHSIVLNRFKTA